MHSGLGLRALDSGFVDSGFLKRRELQVDGFRDLARSRGYGAGIGSLE